MKLREYFTEYGICAAKFAKIAGISLSSVHNILRGKNIQLDVANKIHLATSKKVGFQDMLSEKRRKNEKSFVKIDGND